MLSYKHMKQKTNRMHSLPVDIKGWAKMGLFMDDRRRVCCFCCGYCTAAWDRQDDPWIFHSQCDFAAYNSGKPLPPSIEQEAEGEPLCIVCFEKKIASVFETCNHAICCRKCALSCKTCPLCRAKVYKRLPIYLP